MRKNPSAQMLDRPTDLLRDTGLMLLVASIFLITRLDFSEEIRNIDEVIAQALVESMTSRGDLNANWRLAENLPDYFKYDQFNFYSYHLLALAALSLEILPPVQVLRALNVLLQAGALVLVWIAMRNWEVPRLRRVAAVSFLIVLPTMVMDAHIARTESFLYFLLACIIFIASVDAPRCRKMTLIGLLIGLGTASKVTFLSAALVLVPELAALAVQDRQQAFRSALVLAVASLAGFALGAPYALADPKAYAFGLAALQEQYSTAHPPHSYPGSTVVDWILHLLLFTVVTTGTASLFFFSPVLRQRLWLLGLALMAVAVYCYFATKPVFFERNIGLAMMAAVLVAVCTTRSTLGLIGLVGSFVIMAYWTFQIVSVVNGYDRRADFEMAHFGQRIGVTWPVFSVTSLLEQCKGVAGLADYEDPLSQGMLNEAGEPIARYTGRFALVPTSTLQTYLDTSVSYYNCRTEP